ncbi:odorant receptor Or2-like [Teleopsis dalmanni]|uniref:odorant receptor Or2-like n=1 Tax=Teleopsis dalmanni TaxID=139649 RepID=UPI0018CDD112|nr:odorant receptor Or2-like [Teleopsis dalmanni]
MITYADLKLFSINVKLWKVMGILESKSYKRAVAITALPIVMIFGVFYDGDPELSKILREGIRRANKISKYGLIITSIACFGTTLYPLLLENRKLPIKISVPGINVLESPFYEIIYFVEYFLIGPWALCTYIPFTNLFISWIIFGIVFLRCLQQKLSKLGDMNNDDMLRILRDCVKMHKWIIRYHEHLNELVSFVNLVELLFSGLMVCVLLVFITASKSWMIKFHGSIYIFGCLYTLFLSYWHANEFSLESEKVAESVYGINWMNGSKKLTKCIVIMMSRSQQSLQFRAGNWCPMTLETFQALLNASYSFFTLMQRFSP